MHTFFEVKLVEQWCPIFCGSFFFLFHNFRGSSIRAFDSHTCRQTGPGTCEHPHCAYVWVRHHESMILIPHWHESLKWFWSELLTSVLDRTKDVWYGCAVISHGIRTVQCELQLWTTAVKLYVACDSSAKVIWRLWPFAVFYSHNFFLFKLILICLSLLAVIFVSFHSLFCVCLFSTRSCWLSSQWRHFLRSLSCTSVSGLYPTWASWCSPVYSKEDGERRLEIST